MCGRIKWCEGVCLCVCAMSVCDVCECVCNMCVWCVWVCVWCVWVCVWCVCDVCECVCDVCVRQAELWSGLEWNCVSTPTANPEPSPLTENSLVKNYTQAFTHTSTHPPTYSTHTHTCICMLNHGRTCEPGVPNYGPRAKYGPSTHLDRPSEQCQILFILFFI